MSFFRSDFRRQDNGIMRHRLADIIMLVMFGCVSWYFGRTGIIYAKNEK